MFVTLVRSCRLVGDERENAAARHTRFDGLSDHEKFDIRPDAIELGDHENRICFEIRALFDRQRRETRFQAKLALAQTSVNLQISCMKIHTQLERICENLNLQYECELIILLGVVRVKSKCYWHASTLCQVVPKYKTDSVAKNQASLPMIQWCLECKKLCTNYKTCKLMENVLFIVY